MVDQLNSNASFSAAVFAVGQHGCGEVSWKGPAFKQPFWCTESEVSNGWPAAKGWGSVLNTNFINANQARTAERTHAGTRAHARRGRAGGRGLAAAAVVVVVVVVVVAAAAKVVAAVVRAV